MSHCEKVAAVRAATVNLVKPSVGGPHENQVILQELGRVQEARVQAAHQLSGTNKQVLPVRIDVTQEQSVIDALGEAERRFGKLHIACNNAGVPMHGTRLVDVPVADWAFVIGVKPSERIRCPFLRPAGAEEAAHQTIFVEMMHREFVHVDGG